MKKKFVELFNVIFGFRKFLAWIALFVVAIVFRISNQVDGSQFVDLIKSTFLAFCAANGFEHFVSVSKQYMTSKGVPITKLPSADTVTSVETEREGDE